MSLSELSLDWLFTASWPWEGGGGGQLIFFWPVLEPQLGPD